MRKFKYRKNRNHHHLNPISRTKKGDNSRNNLLLIDIERHIYFHKIFGNRTLDEVINLLCRVRRAKMAQNHYQKEQHNDLYDLLPKMPPQVNAHCDEHQDRRPNGSSEVQVSVLRKYRA